MNHQRVGLDYYSYGNRQCLTLNDRYQETSCAKLNCANFVERNILDFDKKDGNYYRCPEYKNYKEWNQINHHANNYLDPLAQYQYKDEPHRNMPSLNYPLERKKMFSSAKSFDEMESSLNTGNNKGPLLNLKWIKDINMWVPNELHLKSNTKSERRIIAPSSNPNMNEIKTYSYQESRDSPEYLRNYDYEKVGEIDAHYKNTNQNRNVLSRFGNWITLPPGSKNRAEALEKLKYGTFETSPWVPEWMDLNKKNNYVRGQNAFKSFQWNNTCKDKTRVTMLIDRDQKTAIPEYLRGFYDDAKNRVVVSTTK